MRATLGLFLCVISSIGCTSPAVGPDAFVAPVDAAPGDVAISDAARLDGGADGARDASPIDAAATTTRLRIVYPSGHALTVRGSAPPLSWTAGVPATDLGGGVYELVLPALDSDVELKPLIDDATWSVGPNYHLAPGTAVEIAPHFLPGAGRLETLAPAWTSALLGTTRAVYVYLPAAYAENTAAEFPVLYMHDGQNLFDAGLAFGGHEWRVDETMDAAEAGGRCADASPCASDGDCGGARCDTFESTLVVGIANTAARIDEYTPSVDATYGGGGADTYLRAVVEELRPAIDAAYRTRTDAADTALVGSSLGGLVSAYAGIVRPETFGRIGALSPSTWWDERVLITDALSIASRPARAQRVYVDSGDSGTSMDGVADTAELAAAYRSVGYVEGTDFHYVVQPGAEHNEVYWAERLPAALDFLLPRRERPIP